MEDLSESPGISFNMQTSHSRSTESEPLKVVLEISILKSIPSFETYSYRDRFIFTFPLTNPERKKYFSCNNTQLYIPDRSQSNYVN